MTLITGILTEGKTDDYINADLVERVWKFSETCTPPRVAAAAAAKSLQSCPTLCDPIDSSPPGSAIRGFSRQEYWSGLPFPSPKHESEK